MTKNPRTGHFVGNQVQDQQLGMFQVTLMEIDINLLHIIKLIMFETRTHHSILTILKQPNLGEWESKCKLVKDNASRCRLDAGRQVQVGDTGHWTGQPVILSPSPQLF